VTRRRPTAGLPIRCWRSRAHGKWRGKPDTYLSAGTSALARGGTSPGAPALARALDTRETWKSRAHLFTTTLAICISSWSGGTALLGHSDSGSSVESSLFGRKQRGHRSRTGTGRRNEEGEKDARDRGDSANFQTLRMENGGAAGGKKGSSERGARRAS